MNKDDVKTTESNTESTTVTGFNIDTSADVNVLNHFWAEIVSEGCVPSELIDSSSTLSFEGNKPVEKIKAINPTIIVDNSNTTKPYYSILYYDISDNTWHIGYSSFDLSYVRQWLVECFEPIEMMVAPINYGVWTDGVCSVCGSEYHKSFKFCPDCGAKMVTSYYTENILHRK